jgi:hypothetical protein
MADRDFRKMRQPLEYREVLQIEIVARIDAKTDRVGDTRYGSISLERLAAVRFTAFERLRERLGVELNPIRAKAPRPPYGRFIRIDEQTDADTGVLQPTDRRGQRVR